MADMLTLPEFIEIRGDDYCAELFNVKFRTVGSWRRGERYPSSSKAKEIIAVSKGKLTMDSIYRPARKSERKSPVPGNTPIAAG